MPSLILLPRSFLTMTSNHRFCPCWCDGNFCLVPRWERSPFSFCCVLSGAALKRSLWIKSGCVNISSLQNSRHFTGDTLHSCPCAKLFNFDSVVTNIYSQGPNQNNANFGVDNDIANRRKAIIWAIYGKVKWRIYALSSINVLKILSTQ